VTISSLSWLIDVNCLNQVALHIIFGCTVNTACNALVLPSLDILSHELLYNSHLPIVLDVGFNGLISENIIPNVKAKSLYQDLVMKVIIFLKEDHILQEVLEL
jgi:hypothetical protein